MRSRGEAYTVAVHEAGHGLVALRFAIPFRRLRASAVDGAISGCRLRTDTVRHQLEYLAMLCGGAAAETLLLGGYRAGRDPDVWADGFDVADRSTWSGDWAEYQRLKANMRCRVSDAQVFMLAVQTVARDWAIVAELAGALARQGELCRAKVEHIVRYAERCSRAAGKETE